MPRTIRELIIAGGHDGSSGQSFLGHVPGAASGVESDDYLITAVGFTGEPDPDAPGGYPDNSLFNITATLTRAAQAYRIQRNVSAAWSFPLTVGGAGASATLESFSAGGSPSGATHALGLRVRGAYGGSATVGASGEQPEALEPGSPTTDPWPVRWTASVSGGGSGQSSLTIAPAYAPDLGGFNAPLVGASWPLTVDNRAWSAAAFEFEWHATSGYDSLVSSAAQFDLTSSGLYPSSSLGLLPGESLTLYLRYRLIGAGSWTNYGAVGYSDPRPPI